MDASAEKRREFLRGLARAGLAGGLAAAGFAFSRRRGPDAVCPDVRACRGCRASATCPLRRRKEGEP
ncbi:MAG: hypothetical protein JXR94_04510 [Candidatus Hydrogenedentes bacterium]|nr:hypothetical protein [Candidatus Hydrogenedentota bacterium]